MVNKIGSVTSKGGVMPAKSQLMDSPDNAGGFADMGPAGRSCAPAKGEAPKGKMVDGPYGGKVKA